MVSFALPVLIALLIWWVSTGVILALDSLPRATFPRSMATATGLLAVALAGIHYLRNDATVMGAFGGFACGIVVWGWLEMSFLMGYLTGPRRHGCWVGCGGGWKHFGHAIQAILYHEVALIVLALTVLALSWHGTNRVAAWSIVLLWVMRASAKLNLFLGVRNLGAELLPPHLAYLGSYFRKRPMNGLLPLSVTAGTVTATLLIRSLFVPGITDFEATGHSLLATLVVLGVLEHWILVLPLAPTALWSWALRSRQRAAQLRVI